MTQAFNLSQLANKVNSSGSLDASTGLTNAVPVANGGTGLSSTPANGALDIGNGTGFTRTTLTAGTGINVTNSVGSITIASTGAVSSVIAGNGITVSSTTGNVTVSQDFYTGTNVNNTSFPIGSYVLITDSNYSKNATATPYVATNPPYNATVFYPSTSGLPQNACSGTWRARGSIPIPCTNATLSQRVA